MCFLRRLTACRIVRSRKTRLFLRPTESLAIAAGPGVATHVIAALFPKTCLIFREEAHAFDPLRGFPGVQLRNDQTDRTAVFGWNRRAVMQKSKKRIFVQEVL